MAQQSMGNAVLISANYQSSPAVDDGATSNTSASHAQC